MDVLVKSDGLEDLDDDCTVKMRLQAEFVVSPACKLRQPSTSRVTCEPGDLKGDLREPHLLALCFNKESPLPSFSCTVGLIRRGGERPAWV